MLFDLRSGARRRTVKVVYLGLALLMFVGFVGFGIGSSGLAGGIGDAITGNGSSGGGDKAVVERLTNNVNSADAKVKATPTDAAAWAALAQARLRLANVGDNLDPATGAYTAAGNRQLAAAGTAWDKYLALKPTTPDERLARQMANAYLSTGNANKAVTAQEVVTQVDPTQQTFSNLAIFAYQAGQTRKGDLAATKAVDLAPKDEQKDLKTQLDSAKTQALTQQLQQAVPSAVPSSAPSTAPTATPTAGK
jgi:tetratricopeptide (TPR) repeat protein